MKRTACPLISIRLVAVAAILAVATVSALPAAARAAQTHPNVLRLHVVANSDSAEDQRVKLLVRDAILSHMPACGSAAEAEAFVLQNGRALLACAEQTLFESGVVYGAELQLGTRAFPDRTYDGMRFPAGDYRALTVVLGRGAGQNWWCVLFPPLCIVTAESEPLPATDAICFESSLLKLLRSWRNGR